MLVQQILTVFKALLYTCIICCDGFLFSMDVLLCIFVLVSVIKSLVTASIKNQKSLLKSQAFRIFLVLFLQYSTVHTLCLYQVAQKEVAPPLKKLAQYNRFYCMQERLNPTVL